jgi:hypothetical protein
VNSYEAESRRISRFWDQGHTQGTLEPQKIKGISTHYVEETHQVFKAVVPEVQVNKEYPNTLDLRQFHTK